MKLQGKRIALLAENLYQEMELWVPYYRFKEEGAEVKVVGTAGVKGYTSKHGYPVAVDVQAEQVKAVEFDAVVIPGGYAPDMMRRHEAMVNLVREAAQQGKVVAAICHAGWMLVSAGILKGRKADVDLLYRGRPQGRWCRLARRRSGRRWQPHHIRKPDDLPAFCRAIVVALAKA